MNWVNAEVSGSTTQAGTGIYIFKDSREMAGHYYVFPPINCALATHIWSVIKAVPFFLMHYWFPVAVLPEKAWNIHIMGHIRGI